MATMSFEREWIKAIHIFDPITFCAVWTIRSSTFDVWQRSARPHPATSQYRLSQLDLSNQL
jgi:hypothetical protein